MADDASLPQAQPQSHLIAFELLLDFEIERQALRGLQITLLKAGFAGHTCASTYTGVVHIYCIKQFLKSCLVFIDSLPNGNCDGLLSRTGLL